VVGEKDGRTVGVRVDEGLVVGDSVGLYVSSAGPMNGATVMLVPLVGSVGVNVIINSEGELVTSYSLLVVGAPVTFTGIVGVKVVMLATLGANVELDGNVGDAVTLTVVGAYVPLLLVGARVTFPGIVGPNVEIVGVTVVFVVGAWVTFPCKVGANVDIVGGTVAFDVGA
jgi:hypothetical protein